MTSQLRPRRESALRRVAPMAAGGLVIALAAGTLFVTGATLGNLVMGEPAAAASIQPSEPAAAVGTGRATDAQPSAGASPSAGPSSAPPASPSPFATPKPGPFAMDLYRRGDFVGEKTAVWCLAAAVQTSINIMSPGADQTKATQKRLFDLARSLAPAPDGAAEPEGWAKALTRLGFGRYEVSVQPSIKAAITLGAKALRKTNRPVGLLVWRGAHSWVMSGFTATADPAVTDRFTVTAVRIEDVWYPRFSSIWGYSRPPDSLVPVRKLPEDFLPWKRPQARYPAKDGRFVIVIPTR